MTENSGDHKLLGTTGISVELGGQTIVDCVDVSVVRGEIVILIGPNGSGKTTLVRALLGLVKASAGKVFRSTGLVIGYVPQHLQIDATLPMTVGCFLRLGTKAPDRDLEAALCEVGVGAVLGSPIQTLSGGQMRRILLARALLRKPDLLVLDEPTAGVDVSGQAALYELIKLIRDRHRCGVLLVSHNLHLVMAAADRVVCLNHHICCEGQPSSVSRNPAYLELFGEAAANAIAVYTHDHDHDHDLAGAPVSPKSGQERGADEAYHG